MDSDLGRGDTSSTVVQPAPFDIVGRHSELAELERFLDGIHSGPAAILIDGPAGIGKTVVWKEGLAMASGRGYRVLASRPTEPDSALAFSALEDLLSGAWDEVAIDLVEPQREALGVAMRRVAPGPTFQPDPLTVALGVRRALASLAARSPVIVAVDDVQWLDMSSSQALDHALRRLGSSTVGFLGVLEAGEGGRVPLKIRTMATADRVHELHLGPLDAGEFRQLLSSSLEGALQQSTILRIHKEVQGNPFYGLELARALLGSRAMRDPREPFPVPSDLRGLLRERLAGLAADVREALLAMAVSADPTIATIERLGILSEDVSSALEPAVRAGMIEIDGQQLRFTSPLLGTLLRWDASPDAIREVHARLARITTDPEQRARHLGLAAGSPDPETASVVVEAARAVRARAALGEAAELYELAVVLTPSEQATEATARIVEAAACHLDAGDALRARELLEPLVRKLPPGTERAAVLQRLGWVRYHDDSWIAAATLFEQALAEAGGSLALEASIALDSSIAGFLAGDLLTASTRAERAMEQAQAVGDRRLIAEAAAVAGSMAFLVGARGTEQRIKDAVDLETWTRPRPTLKHPTVALGIVLKWSDDYEQARFLLERALRRSLAEGTERSLPFLLFHLAELDCWTGDWASAEERAEEAFRIASQTGQGPGGAFALYSLALIHALRGLETEARGEAEEGLALAERSGAVPASALIRSAMGFLDVSVGAYPDALKHLDPLVDGVIEMGIYEPGVLRYLGDAIEALVGVGELDRADRLVARLEARSRELDRPWGLAVGARGRGLVAAARGDPNAASEALDTALANHEHLKNPFERARTLLALGSIRRRDRQKRGAREALEQALEGFESLGAPLWADRARTEISRIGGRAPSSTALTPTEQRVAELVAQGATNKEVAAALFVSLKTVEWNISRIYRKLGVRSRTELVRWMGSGKASPPE